MSLIVRTPLQIRHLSSRRLFTLALLLLPVYLFVLAFWMPRPLTPVGNIPLGALIPVSFLAGLACLSRSRSGFLHLAGRFRLEFALLLLMTLLCALSLLNSNAPFRSFRIFYPCILPLLLFCQLGAVRLHAPAALADLPRFVLTVGLVVAAGLLAGSYVSSGIKPYLFQEHRYIAFFENPNQHSIVLAALVPLTIVEIALARGSRARLLWSAALVLHLYLILRTGSKTALLVSLGAGALFFFLVHYRSSTPLQRFALVVGVVGALAGLRFFGLQMVSLVDPVVAKKLGLIFSEGVGNYYSIQSREILWAEAIRQGREHWLIGSGAGEKFHNVPAGSHAHNLILEYFRGTGVFGAASVILLCGAILWRGARKTLSVLTGADGPGNVRRWACYISAVIYVVCNQLSDSFGPTTIGVLWLVLMPAVLTEPPSGRSLPPSLPPDRRPALPSLRRSHA